MEPYPKCDDCGGTMKFLVRENKWRCGRCGKLHLDHGDHPGRDDYCGREE